MALIFQLVLFGVAFAQAQFGEQGLYGTAALLGLADVDALTISMAQLTHVRHGGRARRPRGHDRHHREHVVKLGIALVVGRGSFRPLAAIGLDADGTRARRGAVSGDLDSFEAAV